MEREETDRHLTLGAAAAAILSVCFGCFIIGLATVLAASSPAIKESLIWVQSAGSLSGESGIGIIAWLVSWAVLHILYRYRKPNLPFVLLISFVFLALAFVLTFPPFYHSFSSQ